MPFQFVNLSECVHLRPPYMLTLTCTRSLLSFLLFSQIKSNWLLWVPFQFVNFRYVPPQLQASRGSGRVGEWDGRLVGRQCALCGPPLWQPPV